jgi:prephenate dehydratase
VFSHPQGFQQCRLFLERHEGWERVPVTDTAEAVRRVKDSGDPADAAIGSQEEARLQGMEIIEEGIETNPRNYTRFVIIGTEHLPRRPRTKSSLIYSTGNQPGSLFETLKVFADRGINLVKLESRPIAGKPWEYMFYVDLEADLESPSLEPVLREIGEKTDYLKLLGSY